MKALTIWQPYASLIILGEKRFETRRWKATHRGTLAIHAGVPPQREGSGPSDLPQSQAMAVSNGVLSQG